MKSERWSSGAVQRRRGRPPIAGVFLFACGIGLCSPLLAQVAVKGETIYTMAGAPVQDGVVVIRDGKIAAIGPASATAVPDGYRVLTAKVVTPGLIDARASLGLTGIYNINHDQDMLERSHAIQPQLRAIDAYNPQEELIAWVRSFGVTTVHTGHAPGELISGQTAIMKLRGKTVADATMVDCAAIACTLGPGAEKDGDKSPGTRGKMMAMLRQELIRAREYLALRDKQKVRAGADAEEINDDENENENENQNTNGRGKKRDRNARDLGMETLGRVLKRELPLMVTANRAQDINSALRLAEEFEIRLWLDSGSEAYLLKDELKQANVPVLVHPAMYRASGEMKHSTFENAALLRQAGIPVAFTSGFEDYVPKVRVVLFEGAVAGSNGLTFDETLAMLTIRAATILGIEKRVGSIEIGKDGDLALYDGDPLEYTSHCIGTIIEGEIVSEIAR